MIRRGQCGRSGRGETRGLRGWFVQKGGEERRYSCFSSSSTPCVVKGPCVAELRDELRDSGAGHGADKGSHSAVRRTGRCTVGWVVVVVAVVVGCACQRVACGTGDPSVQSRRRTKTKKRRLTTPCLPACLPAAYLLRVGVEEGRRGGGRTETETETETDRGCRNNHEQTLVGSSGLVG